MTATEEQTTLTRSTSQNIPTKRITRISKVFVGSNRIHPQMERKGCALRAMGSPKKTRGKRDVPPTSIIQTSGSHHNNISHGVVTRAASRCVFQFLSCSSQYKLQQRPPFQDVCFVFVLEHAKRAGACRAGCEFAGCPMVKKKRNTSRKAGSALPDIFAYSPLTSLHFRHEHLTRSRLVGCVMSSPTHCICRYGRFWGLLLLATSTEVPTRKHVHVKCDESPTVQM